MSLLIATIVNINMCFGFNQTLLCATVQTYTTYTAITILSLSLSTYNLYARTCSLFLSMTTICSAHNLFVSANLYSLDFYSSDFRTRNLSWHKANWITSITACSTQLFAILITTATVLFELHTQLVTRRFELLLNDWSLFLRFSKFNTFTQMNILEMEGSCPRRLEKSTAIVCTCAFSYISFPHAYYCILL